MYLAPGDDGRVMYIFATKSGAPENPAWYHNLVDSGSAEVEVGTETFPVSVSEISGPDRQRVYAEQARRYPGFGEYAEKTAGIRTIPVLALRRL
jgi:deazaflavin-dependent oxidoreductase (nitroreductase family)